MTGDTYINRIWGDHDLRGRRLYLSVLNLVELYEATKASKYKKELDDRVTTLLSFQERQVGNLLLDRFGYSQTYVAQGLYKYQQITGDEKVKKALLNHARWVRQVPPLNHEMESYLASIYPLLLGYEFSGNRKYFNEALKRAEVLKVGKLPKAPQDYENASAFSKDLLRISNLPKSKKRFTNWELNQGLRVFGWTHATTSLICCIGWIKAIPRKPCGDDGRLAIMAAIRVRAKDWSSNLQRRPFPSGAVGAVQRLGAWDVGYTPNLDRSPMQM